MHKILNILPIAFDKVEAAKLDPNEYEVHFLYASEDDIDKELVPLAYGRYLAKPEFLISYVERAVSYVKKHGITAIVFTHDMASVVASVICEQTGLPGPCLESTFLCLHKYYSRKTENGKLWFDYIHLDDSSQKWKGKIQYPCFLKSPFLCSNAGHCLVKNDTEMEVARLNMKALVDPFFAAYSEFFRRYLDLEKYPLAVENIAVVEELMESSLQYAFDGWLDGDGNFKIFTAGFCELSQDKPGRLGHWVIPQFITGGVEGETHKKLVQYTEMMARRFRLHNTFFDVEFWYKRGSEITLIEINCRMAYSYSAAYRKMWNVSAYQAALYLACGQIDKLMQLKTSTYHEDGQTISGQFYVFTSSEGTGKDLLDHEYARVGCIADGAYNTVGPGATVSVEEDSLVRQTTTVGVCLCNFFLTANDPKSLYERANVVKRKVLRKEEDRDLLKIPVLE